MYLRIKQFYTDDVQQFIIIYSHDKYVYTTVIYGIDNRGIYDARAINC